MKTHFMKAAVAATIAGAIGVSLPLSALAQSNGEPGYWASDGRYYYYPTQTDPYSYPPQTNSRPGAFTTPAPVYNDYLARARTQADADYQRDLASWQAQRDASVRAQADWDARYASTYNPPASYPYPGAPASSNNANCAQQRTNNTTTGGILGALVGAAIGSNLAARNTRTEGTVLGGVVGAAIGAGIGRSTASCDNQGYYYTYDQTSPYQEGPEYRGRNSGRYSGDYYNRQGCRLAPAQYQANEYRYVRVCPDSQGRYRMTD
ncbi:MAG: hypothetical protein JWM33_2069 [Caulobacteraceae bacterium]|nr:hypothetical protein [Caulobacteraceae bacterium]